MRIWAWAVLLCAGAASATAQVGEFSFSAGRSLVHTASLGDSAGAPVDLHDGFHFALRFALNPYRFFGHEFGYAYNKSNIQIHSRPVQDFSTSIHQGFYDFLVYATPEGFRIRPFLAGGAQFSSFYPPGAGPYGGGDTRFGINYGGGVKVRVSPIFGIRFDARNYNTGKPFGSVFANQTGRLNQLEVSMGFSLLF